MRVRGLERLTTDPSMPAGEDGWGARGAAGAATVPGAGVPGHQKVPSAIGGAEGFALPCARSSCGQLAL